MICHKKSLFYVNLATQSHDFLFEWLTSKISLILDAKMFCVKLCSLGKFGTSLSMLSAEKICQ
ncbi:hypothetical protein B0180_06320 [Moraxella canis]|uniref:Uncharacterized protein n=1 Tax=Moraxella canis TaxID=90239 RepID=A0A1S9ZI66_9GAMM|nr:hypothetical protein B0180_06320 [Moraxella canis]